MKLTLVLTLTSMAFAAAMAQTGSINNTVGSGGSFTIKDGSTTFFTVSQANGFAGLTKSLSLPVTAADSTLGVIYKGNQRFIHDYQASGTTGLNTFFGVNAGNFTMSGVGSQASYNTGVGRTTLSAITTGSWNSALGYGSLAANTSGYSNSALGYYALGANTTGHENSAFGYAALTANTTGYYNSAFGYVALGVNTTGTNNDAFGYYSLYANTTGNSNAAFGVYSLYYNTTGASNAAFGLASLLKNTTGNSNSSFGVSALFSNTTGSDNVAVGRDAMSANTTGGQNTAMGRKALYTNSTGFQNTAVGDSALYGNTGNYNTAIGFNAGSQVTSGANLTLIGIDANPSSGTATNEITLGNSYVSTLRCNTQTISSLSDARDKRNIRDLPLGLDFLMTVKPRLFNWDRREWYKDGKPDGSKMKEEPTAGFIAQELDTAQMNAQAEWLNLVLKTNPERLEATSGNLLPVVVKAIQELKAENNSLRTENNLLKDRLTSLEQQVARALELIRHSSTQTSLTEHPNNIKEAQ